MLEYLGWFLVGVSVLAVSNRDYRWALAFAAAGLYALLGH